MFSMYPFGPSCRMESLNLCLHDDSDDFQPNMLAFVSDCLSDSEANCNGSKGFCQWKKELVLFCSY